MVFRWQVCASEPDAVDEAVAGLRYGSVCVNTPTIMGFCLTKATWGAFPGGTPQVRPQVTPSTCPIVMCVSSGVCALHG